MKTLTCDTPMLLHCEPVKRIVQILFLTLRYPPHLALKMLCQGTSLVVQWLGLCDPSAGPGFDLWSGSWIPCAATSISQVTSRDPSADQQIKIFKKLCQNLSRRGFREACDTSLLAWSCNKDFSTPNSSLVGCLASLSPPGTKTCS